MAGLESRRLRFRRIEPSDDEACLPFFEHPLSHQYWDTAGKSGRQLCDEFMDKQAWRYANGKGGALALIDKELGTFVGWCGLLVQEVDGIQELEVGYSILPIHWRKGYASEAAKQCLYEGFARNLADSIISIIQVDNTPSQGVAERNGLMIDKRTTHHGNPVFIFRITGQKFMSLNP